MKLIVTLSTAFAGVLLPITESTAQEFMGRYDASGQARAENGFSVELQGDSGYFAIGGTKWSNGQVVYSSVAYVLRLGLDGHLTDAQLVVTPCCATSSGWANSSFQRSGGGIGMGGGQLDSLGRLSPVLYLFNATGALDTMYSYTLLPEDWAGRTGKQTPDGGYVITGETSASGTSLDGFLLKVDGLGNLEWVQTYGLPNRTEYLTTVDLAPGNGYYLGGQLDAGGGNYDQWLIRVDSAGTVDWDEQYGTQLNDAPNAHVTSLDDGSVVFATGWATVSQYILNLVLVKVDASGMLVWDQAYGADGTNTTLYAVKEVSPGGDLIAVGESSHPDAFNGVLLRTTAQGDSLWLRYYHYADSVWTLGKGTLRDVMPTPDGGFIAVGTAYPSSNNPNDPPIYGQDTWVVKVDSMGCLEPGCHLITGLESQVTTWRGALTVAPNPASGVARLAWELPEGLVGSCQLSVVSAAGHLVGTVPVALAEKSYSLDVTGYPAGLYHVHLVVDGRWVSGGKVVVE